jgi:glycerol transport system ATP-binding protein
LHTRHGGIDLVAQLQGVHQIALGTQLDVYIDPDELFVFGADANLVARPKVQEVAYGAH